MQNVHQVIHRWPFTAFTILHAECSSDAYKTDEHSTWRMFIRCTLTCAILQMLSHLKSGKQRNGYRSIHTSVKSLKSWNSNAFIFSAQKSRQNLNELNCVRILARTAKLNAASNSRKTIDVIVFRVLPVYYLLKRLSPPGPGTLGPSGASLITNQAVSCQARPGSQAAAAPAFPSQLRQLPALCRF